MLAKKTLDNKKMKYDHPLEDTRPYLVNLVNGKRASPNVNVQNSKDIVDKMVQNRHESLPDECHTNISSKIVTMASESNLNQLESQLSYH